MISKLLRSQAITRILQDLCTECHRGEKIINNSIAEETSEQEEWVQEKALEEIDLDSEEQEASSMEEEEGLTNMKQEMTSTMRRGTITIMTIIEGRPSTRRMLSIQMVMREGSITITNQVMSKTQWILTSNIQEGTFMTKAMGKATMEDTNRGSTTSPEFTIMMDQTLALKENNQEGEETLEEVIEETTEEVTEVREESSEEAAEVISEEIAEESSEAVAEKKLEVDLEVATEEIIEVAKEATEETTEVEDQCKV